MPLKSHKSTLLDKKKDNKKETVKGKKNTYKSPLSDYTYKKSDKKKVVAYIRVSTKKESQLSSIEKNQPALINQMFKQPSINKAYELIATYAEWHSGTKVIRPVFQVLLADAGLEITKSEVVYFNMPGNSNKKVEGFKLDLKPFASSKFDEIWVKSTSRFARNIDIVPVLQMLKNQSVIVRFLDIDMSTEKNKISDIAAKILSDMQYSENLSRNIKASRAIAVEMGEPPLKDTFGYIYQPKTYTAPSTLKENKKESDIVRFIYDVYLHGFQGEDYGMHKIINLLPLAIPSIDKPSMFTRKGKLFAKSTIEKILKNETYIGYKRHGLYANTDDNLFNLHKRVTKNKKLKIERDERIEPIVDLVIWAKVQKKLSENTVVSKGKKRPLHKVSNKGKNIYATYLICSYCKSNFRYDNNVGNPFYTCALKEEKGIKYCDVNNVYLEQLNSFISTLADSDYKELFKLDVEVKINSLLNYAENQLSNIDDEGDKITDFIKINKKKEMAEYKLSLLIDDESNNDIESLKKSITTLKETIKDYDEKLKTMSTPTIDRIKHIEKIFSAIENILTYYESIPSTFTNDEILEKIDKIHVSGKRQKKTIPTLIPTFKLSTNNLINDFISKLDVSLPSYKYTMVSGIEYFDTINDYINDKQLNKELKEYLKPFENIEDAKEYSKKDTDISPALQAYILYFDTLDEALSDNKLSPYDKDLRQKDIIKPLTKHLTTSTLNFTTSDLSLRYDDDVLTYDNKGNKTLQTGYLHSFGIEEVDTLNAIKHKYITLLNAFNTLKTNYTNDKPTNTNIDKPILKDTKKVKITKDSTTLTNNEYPSILEDFDTIKDSINFIDNKKDENP